MRRQLSASMTAFLLLAACEGTHSLSPGARSERVSVRQQALATTNDVTIAYIQRTPERNWVWGSSNPTRDGWPVEGEVVTWRAFVRNFGPARSGVQYRFYVDDVLVKTATANLAANASTPVDLARPWDFARHAIRAEIDTSNAIAEQQEGNNSLTVDSNALSVGFWVERTLYNYFRDHQQDLVGVGSTCWENWAQRQVRRANGMFAAALSDVAPLGALDRWRIDKIVIVDDGALPLRGGPYPTNDPDADDISVDLQWGFPSSLLDTTDHYDVTNVASDKYPFYYEGALNHELGHARYLVDVYGFNVHANAAGTQRDRIDWTEGGVPVVGSKYLPALAADLVYKSHIWGLMNGPYTFLDLHSSVALNLIAGHRATEGNRNNPVNMGVYLNQIPAQNRITLLDGATGAPLAGANVRLYRAHHPEFGFYIKPFDPTPALEATADGGGAVDIGANPFKDGAITWRDGIVLLLRIAHGNRVRYHFMEPADFNLEYWRGHTTLGQYTMRVDFRETAANDQKPTVATPAAASPATVTGNTTSLSVLGADDAGEPGLTYTWSVIDSPPVLFTPNFSNAAKNTTATFTAGGLHKIRVTINDGSGLDEVSLVDVTVNPGATVTVEPEADAYVRNGASADSKFGTAAALVVKTQASPGNERWSYLRFPIAAAPGAVSSAKLRLHGSRPTASGAIDSAFGVPGNGWSEADVTWNTRPGLGPVQGPGNVVMTGTGSYHVWDVTSFVKAQKAAGATAVTLAIKMDADTSLGPDTFSAREAASNRPQLVITGLPTGGGGGSTTTTLSAVADAHVRDGTSAGTNFGTLATLEQKSSTAAGNNRRAFLRFAIDGIGSNVTAARLRLTGSSVTTAKLVSIHAVSSVTWGETTITWNNAPAIGAKQGASQSVGTTAATTEWDLTSYLQAQKAAGATAVSLEVKQDLPNNETPTTFNARTAAANPPELVVTTSP